MAKKSSTKNKSTLLGTASADVLTVKHSQVTVNAGKGNDTINVTKGSSHKIYGEAGKDTITVKSTSTGMKIYGDDAKSKLTGNDTFNINAGKKNYFYGGKGADTFNVNGGNTNYIYGGAGNDVIVIGKNSTGTATVKDYSMKSGNTDKVLVNGGAVKSVTSSGKNLIVKGGKSASITLEKAADKTISLQDNRGSYTVSKTEIKLDKDFTGTMDATKYLSTVMKIDARNATKKVNITGNAKANTIYAGKAGGTLNGGAGNDTLYGGAGKDTFVYATGNETIYNYASGSDTIKLSSTTLKSSTISGNDAILNLANGHKITVKNAANVDILVVDSSGESLTIINSNATGGGTAYGSDGADTFVYNPGEGNVTIKGYKEGEDILQIADGEITKTEIVDGNVVLTVGDNGNTITLEEAAGKSIEIHNNNGSFTLSEEEISLGTDYTGDIDANAYPSMVTTIDGRNAKGKVNITGNAQNNNIYAGTAGGTLKGGAGDDVYTVTLPNESKISLIEIDNSGQLDSDADCLVIENLKGVNPDIHFDRKRTVLSINTSQGTIITVKNWDTNPLSYLLLSGISTLTTNQINSVYGAIKYVKISQNSTTYYGDIDTQKIDVTCLNSDIHTGMSGDIVTIIGSFSQSVTGGQNNRIYGGPGSDLIKDSQYRNTIYGGDGDDEIHGSTLGSIYGDNGDDIIEVGNASGYFVKGGAGSDQITVSGQSGSFYGEDGNDTFTIDYATSDENNNILIDGGSGNDTYICNIRSLKKNGILIIDNQSASKTDMDFLKVMWTKAEEFILSLNEDSTELSIKQSSKNAGIVVKGWNTYPLSKIEFSDATYTAEQINTMVAASSQVDLGALQSACLTFGDSSVMGNQELTGLTIAGGNKQQIQVVPTNTK